MIKNHILEEPLSEPHRGLTSEQFILLEGREYV